MCPACLSTLALMFAGVTSTGGLTLLVVRKLRGQSGATNVEPKLTPMEVEFMNHDQIVSPDESSQALGGRE